MRNAADVLTFWFDDHGVADWFGGKPDFDAAIAGTCAETHAALARGEGWTWRSTPGGRLAEIIVLDQGVVAERGTHQVLLANGGLYANMWRHQHEANGAQAVRKPADREARAE